MSPQSPTHASLVDRLSACGPLQLIVQLETQELVRCGYFCGTWDGGDLPVLLFKSTTIPLIFPLLFYLFVSKIT